MELKTLKVHTDPYRAISYDDTYLHYDQRYSSGIAGMESLSTAKMRLNIRMRCC